MTTTIHYGKAPVRFYRTRSDDTLFAAEIHVDVLGENFLPAYIAGDNTNVVPTDTMKNFVYAVALEYDGTALEGFLDQLGRRFLATYPHMEHVRLRAQELPFLPCPDSTVLFRRSNDDFAVAELELRSRSGQTEIVAHRCGREELQLIKTTGSSFARFPRDAYTTLPEREDRPLFIHLNVYWKYRKTPIHVFTPDPDRTQYVDAVEVRLLVQAIFHEFVSKSIQHLVYEMGQRLLKRFPQLAEVSFEAQNRLWDAALASQTDPKVKVYCDPRPSYGRIGLTLHREHR